MLAVQPPAHPRHPATTTTTKPSHPCRAHPNLPEPCLFILRLVPASAGDPAPAGRGATLCLLRRRAAPRYLAARRPPHATKNTYFFFYRTTAAPTPSARRVPNPSPRACSPPGAPRQLCPLAPRACELVIAYRPPPKPPSFVCGQCVRRLARRISALFVRSTTVLSPHCHPCISAVPLPPCLLAPWARFASMPRFSFLGK